LPNNKQGSRILTTTREEDVAALCSRRPRNVVFEMSALEDDHPRMLFRGCCVHAEEKEWPHLLKESSERMLGGVPLAIITSAGGLLGRASDEEQQVVLSEQQLINETVLSELVKLDESQATRKILDICYVRRSVSPFEVLSPVLRGQERSPHTEMASRRACTCGRHGKSS
jgi:hypothetical protein